MNEGFCGTPNVIDVLLHCYVCPEPHPRRDAPAVQEAHRDLMAAGLIRMNGNGGWSATRLGEAHVKQLCRLKWPRVAYIGADGEMLDVFDE